MNPLNSVLLEGNVVRQPEIKRTGKGTPHCTFSVASNRTYKGESGKYEEEVSFIDVTSWGALASTCSEKCVKGRGVRVVGRLQQGRWKDADGKMQSKLSIIAEHVEFKPEHKKEEADTVSAASAPSVSSESSSDVSTSSSEETVMQLVEAASETLAQKTEEVVVF